MPLRRLADGVSVAVRLTPKAGADRIDGVAESAAGGVILKARVTAAPESGKANAALLKLLAKRWKLPKSALSIAGGARDRNKVVHVAGDPAALYERLSRWLKEPHD
ncbi:MAG: DUF167 family protein [Gammaproteobacteria bacterium]|jgi:hypothetical protein